MKGDIDICFSYLNELMKIIPEMDWLKEYLIKLKAL